MRNNIILPTGVDGAPFLHEIQVCLSGNLNSYLMRALSNMLALDYANRALDKAGIQLKTYIADCVLRLKKHLKHKVLVEEDFSSVMSLFAIAITFEKNLDDESINSKAQQEDLLIEGIIVANFQGLSPDEHKKVKEVLRTLINNPDSKEIMNFINSDPKLFYSIVFSVYKEKTQQKEIMESVAIHLTKVMTATKAANKTLDNVKTLAGKITLGVGLFAVASIGFLIGGVALPALLIPAAIVSIRLAPVIGNKIGESLVQNNSQFQQKQSALKALVKSIVHPAPECIQEQAKYVEQKKSADLEAGLKITVPQAGVKRLEATKELAQNKQRER